MSRQTLMRHQKLRGYASMIQMIYDERGRRWSLKQRTRRATRLHAAVQPSLERKISRGLDELLYFYRDRSDSKSGLASLFSTRFRNLVMIQRNPKKTKKNIPTCRFLFSRDSYEIQSGKQMKKEKGIRIHPGSCEVPTKTK